MLFKSKALGLLSVWSEDVLFWISENPQGLASYIYLVSSPIPTVLSRMPNTQLMLSKCAQHTDLPSGLRTHFLGCWEYGQQTARNPLQNLACLGGAASAKVMPSFQGSHHLGAGQWEGAGPGLPACPPCQLCRAPSVQSSPWGWLGSRL